MKKNSDVHSTVKEKEVDVGETTGQDQDSNVRIKKSRFVYSTIKENFLNSAKKMKVGKDQELKYGKSRKEHENVGIVSTIKEDDMSRKINNHGNESSKNTSSTESSKPTREVNTIPSDEEKKHYTTIDSVRPDDPNNSSQLDSGQRRTSSAPQCTLSQDSMKPPQTQKPNEPQTENKRELGSISNKNIEDRDVRTSNRKKRKRHSEEIGDVGYVFTKMFPGYGLYNGIVVAILPSTGSTFYLIVDSRSLLLLK